MKGDVLVIDDNEMDVRIIKSVLEREGFACHGFINFREGVEWAKTNQAHFIFLDLQMPDITGFDLIPIFKSNPLQAKASIIIISGKNQIEDVKKAVQLGAGDYIVKPVDPLVLQDKMRKSETEEQKFSRVSLPAGKTRLAFVSKPIEICELSEFGARVILTTAIKPGEMIDISGLSEEIFGSERIVARCLSCETTSGGAIMSQLTFVGMTEPQRQIIRKACRKIWVESKNPE